MEKMFDKLWKKCLITFLIIFIIVAVGGAFSINYLHDAVTSNNVHNAVVTVKEKIHEDDVVNNEYLVIDKNNKTYMILERGDGHGKSMFNSIQEKNTYNMVVKEPDVTEMNQFTTILQVHNDTSRNS